MVQITAGTRRLPDARSWHETAPEDCAVMPAHAVSVGDVVWDAGVGEWRKVTQVDRHRDIREPGLRFEHGGGVYRPTWLVRRR